MSVLLSELVSELPDENQDALRDEVLAGLRAGREEAWPLPGTRISREDYLALPDEYRVEWVDGKLEYLMPPMVEHGGSIINLAVILRAAFPDAYLGTDVSLDLPRQIRRPDLMMTLDYPENRSVVTERPDLVVEMLSPSNRSNDTIRKAAEYAARGIEHYWMIDPEFRTIYVMRRSGDGWELVVRLDDEHPTATPEIAGVAVPLDLRAILRR